MPGADRTWREPITITPADRARFKECRRAWDLGSRLRRSLQPVGAEPRPAVGDALREALAVYYYPGMWDWGRAVVGPLVRRRFDEAIDGADDDQIALGWRVLDQYTAWAADVDRFTPVQVRAGFEIVVPDPTEPGLALVGRNDRPVRFRDRIDAVVVDDARRYWLLHHRVADRFAEPGQLRRDEAVATRCWAWSLAFLGMEPRGVIHNEIALYETDAFRRTRLRIRPAELDRFGAQLAAEALDMSDPDLQPYPNPEPSRCAQCSFREPCTAMFTGADGDAEEVLAEAFQPRPPEQPEPGRLGDETWSIGRGAAPPARWRT